MYICMFICIYISIAQIASLWFPGKVLETLADPLSYYLLFDLGPLKELSVTVLSSVKWVGMRVLVQAVYIKCLAQVQEILCAQ